MSLVYHGSILLYIALVFIGTCNICVEPHKVVSLSP